MSSTLFKKAEGRCIRFDRNRNSIEMVDPADLPKNHRCVHCAPPKENVICDPTPAPVQLTSAVSKLAPRPRPSPRCIRFDPNRNVVTMVDDSELGDEFRCEAPKIQMSRRKLQARRKLKARRGFKAPSAYFGRTLEKYMEMAKQKQEEERAYEMPSRTRRPMSARMVNSSLMGNERLRSSLAILDGGSHAEHRVVRYMTEVPTARRRSPTFHSPRSRTGTGRSLLPDTRRRCISYNPNRNSIVMVDPSELPADHKCEHCSPPSKSAPPTPETAQVYLPRSRNKKAKYLPCACVKFDRNRNEIIMTDHRCKNCESNLVIKTKMDASNMKIRAML